MARRLQYKKESTLLLRINIWNLSRVSALRVLEVDFIVVWCRTDGTDMRLQNVTASKNQRAEQSDTTREHLCWMHRGALSHSLSTLILNGVWKRNVSSHCAKLRKHIKVVFDLDDSPHELMWGLPMRTHRRARLVPRCTLNFEGVFRSAVTGNRRSVGDKNW